MAANKETSVGIKLVADLRNYQTSLKTAQTDTQKFSRNIRAGMGDVKSSISALIAGDITALPSFFKSATTAAGGFAKGLQGVKIALISTGIGAILVGLGVAIASITRYFKDTEEGQIAFKKVMNSIKAYTEPVLQMFGRFGKALFHLFKGEFRQAWETAKSAVTDVGDTIKKNTENLGELNALEEKLVKSRRMAATEEKKLMAEISELRNKAKDTENYTAQQNLAFIDQAVAKQKKLGIIRNELADDELKLAQFKADQGDNDIETNDHLVELENQKLDIQKQEADGLREVLETRRSIVKQVQAEIDARKKVIDDLNKTSVEVDVSINIDAANFDKEIDESMSKEFDSTVKFRTPDISPVLGPVQKLEKELQDLKNTQQQSLSPEQWKKYQDEIDATQQKIDLFTGAVKDTVTANEELDSLSDSFGQLGSAIGGTAGSFLDMVSTILALIPQLITQIAALTAAEVTSSQTVTAAKGSEAIASGTAASQKVPFPLNIIALAVTIAGIIKALATKPPELAFGGIAYGNTLARVGEYPGARSNPEVIAPLDKLKSIITLDKQAENNIFIPDVRLKGEDLYILFNRTQQRLRRQT